jgi:hypothetical protein
LISLLPRVVEGDFEVRLSVLHRLQNTDEQSVAKPMLTVAAQPQSHPNNASVQRRVGNLDEQARLS